MTEPRPVYGIRETIEHWRRQSDLTDSDIESATFLHCAEEASEVPADGWIEGVPIERGIDVERLLRAIERTSGFGRDIDYATRLAAEYFRLGKEE